MPRAIGRVKEVSSLTTKEILDGLVVELDPIDIAASGNEVQQFNNTSGVGGPCVVASGTRATFIESDSNFANQPSVLFSGTSSEAGSWYTLPDLSELTAGEAFIVLKCDYSYPDAVPASTSYMGLWQLGTAEQESLYNDELGRVLESFGSSALHQYQATGVRIDQVHIYNVRADADWHAGSQSMVPGGIVHATTENAVAFPAAPVFGRSSASAYFNGRLGYLAITDRRQTPEARAEMLCYLANRFGIALVPAAEPKPKDILDGLRVELDPNDTVVSDDRVAQFNNTNGVGGARAQATLAYRALLVREHAAFANQPVAVFSGGVGFGNAYPLPDLSDFTEGEVFVVVANDFKYASPLPTSQRGGFWLLGGTTTLYPDSSGNLREGFSRASGQYTYPDKLNWSNPHVYNVRAKIGNFEAWNTVKGVLYTNSAPSIKFPSAGRFGSDAGGQNQFNGRLAYLAIADKVQTDAARRRMLTYLVNRFGISLGAGVELPGDPPYEFPTEPPVADPSEEPPTEIQLPKDFLDGLYLEMDPTDVVMDGDGIAQFNNTYGGGGPIPQPTVSYRATLVMSDAAFDGQPVAEYKGGSGFVSAYPLPDLSALSEGEAFVVMATDYWYPSPLPTGGERYGLWRIGASTANSYYPYTDGTIRETFGIGSSSYNYGAAFRHDSGAAFIYNVRASPGDFHAWNSFHGQLHTATPVSVAFSDSPLFGTSHHYLNSNFNGRVAYLAITNKVQTVSARVQMLIHLATRFGITLPEQMPKE